MNNKRPTPQPCSEADEKQLRNLAANTLFGLALVDQDLRLLRFNRKFSAFFPHIARGDLLCEGMAHDCAGSEGCAACPVKSCLASGKNFEREFVRRIPGEIGRYYRLGASLAQLAGSPEKSASSSEGGLALVLVEDISRKRLIEQKLLRAQRLEAMSTLAGGIAHEINQPLSALHLYAGGLQMLLEKNELPPPAVLRERISLILDQARKISEITQHMRATATRAASVLEDVDVPAAVQAALRTAQPQLRAHGIQVVQRRPHRLPKVRAVSVQLAQIFSNLIANAVQAFTSPEGAVLQGEKKIEISLSLEGDKFMVEVADSGPGIPNGLERRIFDPFFSTKGPSGGMGLGLSIVHAFLRSWEGEIQIVPQHPRLGGAAFNIALKIAESSGE